MKVAWNATNLKKSWHWKPKLAQHNSNTKIIVCDVMLCEEKMLMITHNTMLQGEYVNDNLHNNVKNWEFKFANGRAKINLGDGTWGKMSHWFWRKK
jgi:hypothetical protein